MEVGLVYDLRNPPEWRVPTNELYAETLDHIQAVEELGFPAVWVTEHHFIDDEYLPSTLAFAAAIAVKTSRVTIGTAVLLLPLHDAVKVAEEAAVVDQLSNGRFRLGAGLGYKLEEFESFQVPRSERGRLMDEGVEVIRKAWADGPFTYEGKHYRLQNINVTPKPMQRPGPEIWLAARAEASVRRAARIGDGAILAAGTDMFERYLALRREYGRTGPDNLCTFAYSLPTDDPGRAWEEFGPYARYRMALYSDWYGAAADLQSDTTWKAALDAGALPGGNADIFRSVDDTIADLKALEAAGVSSVVYFGTFPGARPSATLPFFETMAKHVLPAVGSRQP